jgi:DNA-binding GntR family transcriptional regulator
MAPENGKDRATQTYRRLRELIVHGRLAPGARIIESDVADRLGVSRTPVRSALQRLEQEGYIQSPSSGGRWRPAIAPLTKEDADELLHLIGQLEGLAAWYSVRLDDHRHHALVTRLREVNASLEQSTGERPRQPGHYYELDRDFHNALVTAAGGPRLIALLRAIKPQAERYVRVYVSALTDQIETSVREHSAIIRAVEDRDATGAQRATEANWRGAARRLAGVIAEVGERGSW